MSKIKLAAWWAILKLSARPQREENEQETTDKVLNWRKTDCDPNLINGSKSWKSEPKKYWKEDL